MYSFFDVELLQALPPVVTNDLVWHYTSAAGALGILRSRTLWLESVRMMNDSGEISHGFDVISRVWDTMFGELDPEHSGRVAAVLEQARTSAQEGLFIACAATVRDSLSQYRAYGPYALGLNAGVELRARMPERSDDIFKIGSELNMQTTRADLAAELGWRPVMYDLVAKERQARKVLDEVVKRTASGPVNGFWAMMLEALVLAGASFMKHESFAEEHEVRLFARIELEHPAVDIHERSIGLAPYLAAEVVPRGDLEVDLDFVIEARLGPGTPDPDAAFDGLSQALRKLGYPRITPQLAGIPLRT